MYMNKNKAFSLVEIIIAISLTLIVGSICIITFYSMNKSFLVMNKTYKRDKEIASFRDLLVSHIKWNEGVEIRISNLSKNQNINSLGNLFLKESEKEGNLLVLKIQAYNESEKTTSRYYRCFLFYEDKVSISYFYEGEYRTYASKNENDVLARPDYPIFVISYCDDKWCEVVEKCSDIKVFVKKSDIIPYKR